MDNVKLAALVREIRTAAPTVGQEYADQQAAFEAERSAEEKLFGAVIEMAQPALPAISNNIATSFDDGVMIFDGKTSNDRPLRVYVLTDGRLFETWEVLDHDEERWFEKGKEQTLRYIVQKYDVPQLIAALHTAIMKQFGKRLPSTATAKDGAAKLNAILTLLEVSPAANEPATDTAASDIPF